MKNGYFVSDVTVKFKASDDKGIKSVTATLNGEALSENIYEKEGVCPGEVEDEIIIGSSVLAKAEPEDFAYELKLSIENSEGKESQIEKTFLANINAPVVNIKGAENGGIYASDRKISISVKDENAKNVQLTATVKHNGKTISQIKDTADKGFSYETSEEGRYEIVALAEDVTRRTDTVAISFTLDKSGPQLLI